MPLYRFTVGFGNDTMLPEDVCTNTFHVNKPSLAIASDFDNVRDALKDFYDEINPGGVVRITSFYASTLSGTATVKAWNMDDPQPRAPQYESSFTFTPGSADTLPQEVALVLSFQTARESGEPQSRRRNRVYLGPFGANALGGTQQRPSSSLITAITASAEELMNALEASSNWDHWSVFSPTTGEEYPVTDGWVDNAWDTQRRRGYAPTSRSLWP